MVICFALFKAWKYSSVVKCLPYIYKILGLISTFPSKFDPQMVLRERKEPF